MSGPRALIASVAVAVTLLGGAGSALLGLCGPFTDVTDAGFCPFVLEIFTLGITTGTSPTTYDPTSSVSRLQMAAFLSRTVDGVLQRGSRRAALDQFWAPQNAEVLGLTTVGSNPGLVASDGKDVWTADFGGTVSRVRASDGKLLETWTGAFQATSVLVAMGRVFATGSQSPGSLYRIDPSQAAGAVTTVASDLAGFPVQIAFDGSRIWASSLGPSVSIVTPGASIPWTVTTATAGFTSVIGVLHDGANTWVTDRSASTLLKLDGNGAVLQTVTVGPTPFFHVFDGGNIWVPNINGASVTVVRVSTGAVLATLTGNGLSDPTAAAFDGKRVLVTNQNANTISLFKAADLTPLGFLSTGPATVPYGVCSDGVNFWIILSGSNHLARF